MTHTRQLMDRSLAAFRHDLANRTTPGCGAAAAVAADFGLALIEKGIAISAGDNPSPESVSLAHQLEKCSGRLSTFADEDAEAFAAFLKSSGCGASAPAAGASDERQSSTCPEAKLINEVPLNAAVTCLDGMRLVESALLATSPSLRSDVLAGARMLHCSLQILLRVVDENLAVLDEQLQNQLRAERNALQDEADQILSGL